MILITVAVIFFTTVWMARFDIVPAASPGGDGIAVVYKIDRWTGRVDRIVGSRSREVLPQ